ncbi:ABC transporter permease [Caldilinea sp.]|jgi:peptide/nickel transport system permease protein|uniref:ABC transporter permease n=1 Tax=Caldilinea sp. TaxID=2293560 RepID=UPI0021DE19C4|nr:ABC transporter permease [Caldilinea sp.]GIV68528.1 MAG: peptide ABC transporter permease [Caldilinea sp.]
MSELTVSQALTGPGRRTMEAAPLRVLIWRRFLRHRLAVVAMAVLGLVIASAVFAPLSRYTPTQQNPTNALQPPSLQHWFGTDDLGRDVFTRTLYGGRISLAVGLSATLLSLLIGVVVGMVAGYFGGVVDNVLMRITDGFLTLPTLFVLILIATLLREIPALGLVSSVIIVILVIAVLSWMWPARIVRGEFLRLKQRDFVTAAESIGAGHGRIMARHILPNTVSLIIVQGTLMVAYAIITESGLSYLGFGVQPPTPSWGNLLATAQTYALRAPWLMIFPGLMIFITSMAINYIGDGLRDAFDPYSAR